MVEETENPKVLIVDDEPANVWPLAHALGEQFNVNVTTSGKEPIELAQSELPDLILLDVRMPDINGFAIFEELKKGEATKDIPVIFVTAANDQQSEEKALKMGAVDYVHKPFYVPIVVARIKNNIELKLFRDLLKVALKKSKMEPDGLLQFSSKQVAILQSIRHGINVQDE